MAPLNPPLKIVKTIRRKIPIEPKQTAYQTLAKVNVIYFMLSSILVFCAHLQNRDASVPVAVKHFSLKFPHAISASRKE